MNEWENEPDRVEFKTLGLPCLIRRVENSGNLCGYVAVPPGHKYHGIDYDNLPEEIHDVHGGVTFAGPCHGDICHVPPPGEPDGVWWFGFDCAHGGDLLPLMAEHQAFKWSTYRNISFVKSECEKLARLLYEPKDT